MRAASSRSSRPAELGIVLAVCGLALWVWMILLEPPIWPERDALRYVDYVVALVEHGTFGLLDGRPDLAPAPGNANAPLYMALVAGVAALDGALAESLACIARAGPPDGCPRAFASLYALHLAMSALAVTCVYALAQRLLASRMGAALAAALVVASGQLSFYARDVMTENLVLPLFLAAMLALLGLAERPSLTRAAALGLLIGALTLTRPSYLYLFGAVAAGTALLVVWPGRWVGGRRGAGVLAALLLGFALVVLPWMVRNAVQIGAFELAGGRYGPYILAQRVAYNAMSWGEWAIAFVYWFPDFGDDLAEALAPRHTARLGWGAGSFYEIGNTRVYDEAFAELSREPGTGHFLRAILAEPVKHVAVSAALAWRAIFVSKYWGLAGLACSGLLLWRADGALRARFALLLAPMAFMVAFHAAVSVSVLRYNLFLLAPYAIAMSWLVLGIGERLRARGA